MSEEKKQGKIKPFRIRWDKPGPRDHLPLILYFPERKVTVHTDNPEQFIRLNEYKNKKP